MNIMATFFNEVFFRPIFNALFFLYSYLPFHDLGAAIILLTVGIRLLLYPLFQKSLVAQKKMSEIQPEIKRIQETYKDNKEEQAKKLMELYREKKVNPFSGCLPILIQLPILIALYRVFLKLFDHQQATYLYTFIAAPTVVNAIAFGFLDLSAPSIVLAVLAGASQFFQAATMPQPAMPETKKGEPDFAKIMQYQAKYFFPFLIFFLSFKLPAALSLYWTVLNLFAIVQQKLMTR